MTSSIDDGLCLPRKLTREENVELHSRLRPFIKTTAPDEAEFVADLLDYAVAMVSNSKSIRYVIDNLIAMEMEFCTDETAELIGKNIHEYLRSIIESGDAKVSAGDIKEGNSLSDGQKSRIAVIKSKESSGNALRMAGALGSSREGRSLNKNIQDGASGPSNKAGKDIVNKKKDSMRSVDNARKTKALRVNDHEDKTPNKKNESRDQRGQAFDRLSSNLNHRGKGQRGGESRDATQERRNIPKGREMDSGRGRGREDFGRGRGREDSGRGRGRDRSGAYDSHDRRGRSGYDRDDKAVNDHRDTERFDNNERFSHQRGGPPSRDNQARSEGSGRNAGRSFHRSVSNNGRGHSRNDTGNQFSGRNSREDRESEQNISGNRRHRDDYENHDVANPEDESEYIPANNDRSRFVRGGRTGRGNFPDNRQGGHRNHASAGNHRPGTGTNPEKERMERQTLVDTGGFYSEGQEQPSKRVRGDDNFDGAGEEVQDNYYDKGSYQSERRGDDSSNAGRHSFRGGFRGRGGGRHYQGGRGFGGRTPSSIEQAPRHSSNEMMGSVAETITENANADHHANIHPSPIVAAAAGYSQAYYRGGYFPRGRGRGRGRSVYHEQPDVKSFLATKTWVRNKGDSGGENAADGGNVDGDENV